jgi:O-antigen ligase
VRSSHRWGASIAVVSILSVQLFGLLAGAWLGTTIGVLFLAWRRRRPSIAIALIVALVALSAVPGPLRDTAAGLFDPTSSANAERLQVARNGAQLFVERPLTGWGLHALRDEYERVKAPGDAIRGHLGSLPMQVAASMGLAGLVALGWLLVALFRRIGRARRDAGDDPFLRAIIDGSEAGLVAFLGAGLVAWDFGDSEILALLFFLMGTAIAAGHVARAEKAERGA